MRTCTYRLDIVTYVYCRLLRPAIPFLSSARSCDAPVRVVVLSVIIGVTIRVLGSIAGALLEVLGTAGPSASA